MTVPSMSQDSEIGESRPPGAKEPGAKEIVERAAISFLAGPANKRGPLGERLFAEPLFGYAKASDPLWEAVAENIGDILWRPEEAFERAFPGSKRDPSLLSVAVMLCPQTKATIEDQRNAVGFPAERWVRSRFLHDQVIDPLCDFVTQALADAGIRATTPDHLEGFGMVPHPVHQLASQWSHRHAAFVAGLGTFGLCDGLITKVGKAHRLGSLVIEAPLAPTPRAYKGPYDYCLFHAKGRCAKCVDRCPAGALSKAGHDKILCQAFLASTTPKINELWPDLAGAYGCGLCQSAVPCDTHLPGALVPGELVPGSRLPGASIPEAPNLDARNPGA